MEGLIIPILISTATMVELKHQMMRRGRVVSDWGCGLCLNEQRSSRSRRKICWIPILRGFFIKSTLPSPNPSIKRRFLCVSYGRRFHTHYTGTNEWQQNPSSSSAASTGSNWSDHEQMMAVVSLTDDKRQFRRHISILIAVELWPPKEAEGAPNVKDTFRVWQSVDFFLV